MEGNNLNQQLPKVSFAKKVGYSIGGATDTLAYDFVAAFLLFFSTNYTGVSPAWAGTILTLGVVWNMISDPIVGNLSDKTRTRFGKKRTWLLIAIIPLFATYLLLFTSFDFSTSTANISLPRHDAAVLDILQLLQYPVLCHGRVHDGRQ